MTREERLAKAREAMLLYAVTDRAWTDEAAGHTLEAQVAAALADGATCVQLREKALDDADFLEEAFRVRDLCRAAGVPFFVNDNVGVALAVGADGVHVGQEDMPVREVRRLVGPDMLVGVSACTVDEALEAVAGGADCLGVGAMIATPTKTDARVVSVDTLRDICAAVDVPVVAIGGLNRENIGMLAGCGVAGVALVSAIFAAPDIGAACRELRQLACAAVCGPTPFTAALFDFDGTLFDSMYVWDNSADEFLRRIGRDPIPGLFEEFRRMTLEEGAAYMQAKYAVDLPVSEIVDGINAVVEGAYANDVLPKPGAVDFVRALRAIGVRCAICTATDAYQIEAALTRCGIRSLFDGIFTCGGLHTSKHEPFIWREAARALGATQADTVVFEDARHCIETAKADGFAVVCVADSYEPDQDALAAIADCHLDTFAEPQAFWDFARTYATTPRVILSEGA